MPILSMFYGVVVYMFFYDNQKHNLPHIHVEFAEYSAVIDIEEGNLLDGNLPKNKMKLVQAWLEIHREEVLADWSLAVRGLPVQKIKPLS
tara:strand:- start:453 stop:722 length:270 start_codon:yes stop_codon:yes gene_type:complete